jgi:hypothetical protein
MDTSPTAESNDHTSNERRTNVERAPNERRTSVERTPTHRNPKVRSASPAGEEHHQPSTGIEHVFD